jgi:PAS domain-containing protein
LATHSTGLDLARLERALRCLLSPLSGDASAWPAAACAAVRDVFEVEGTGHLYFVRGADPRPTILHSDASPLLVEQYNAVADHDVSSQRIQARRVEVAHPYTVMDREEYLRSTAYQEVFRPHEIGGFVSLLLPSEAGLTARLSVASTALLETSQAERALASARVLLPAFRAGFTQWHQLGAPAGTLARSLDALADGVLVCDSAGRPRHENTALVALLAGEPGAALVRAAAHDLARGVGALGSASGRRTGSAASLAPPAVERVVPAGGGAYRLRATLVVSGTFGDDPMVLVTVGLVASPGCAGVPARSRRRSRHAGRARRCRGRTLRPHGAGAGGGTAHGRAPDRRRDRPCARHQPQHGAHACRTRAAQAGRRAPHRGRRRARARLTGRVAGRGTAGIASPGRSRARVTTATVPGRMRVLGR